MDVVASEFAPTGDVKGREQWPVGADVHTHYIRRYSLPGSFLRW